MSEQQQTTSDEREGEEPFTQRFVRELTTGSVMVTFLSVVLALIIGAILIAVSDPEVQDSVGYFTDRPSDTFSAIGDAVGGAYSALFTGSIIDFSEYTVGRALLPLGETLTNATPLIAAGLGFALAFRAGLFNIGGEGQIILGAIFAGYVGFGMDLPVGIHLVLGVAAGMLGGALWGGIVGFLKARTGAHEVIVTIMLNYIARFLIAYLLTTSVFQRAGASNPVSPQVHDSAVLPTFFDSSRLHLGFILVFAAAAGVWWLLSRSTVGFEFRAVGANPHAARTAGMSVARAYILVMVLAGALAGLAGVAQVLGTERYLTSGISSGIGFDAITVALLGRANPWGTVAAGLLFGALRAGAVTMQASTGTSVDIILVIQSLIVLFIAAPPLVRTVFRVRVRDTGGVGARSMGWGS
ncbi:nucleoside ABC transporter membrane protein [Haloactinopolyspora alba]|uniref:Nucleoside ABC transporter membrane protein n=1 Tax=Haloactinopolyspora alba TaxID=648780 RepID=A0A2P8E169_9ACTN|nr:ABC transporter permease [Haloactinopolyspora alba]PSL03221.1 nucleoside ABC transporter membrane protein [Haloactinopolyspora alba]